MDWSMRNSSDVIVETVIDHIEQLIRFLSSRSVELGYLASLDSEQLEYLDFLYPEQLEYLLRSEIRPVKYDVLSDEKKRGCNEAVQIFLDSFSRSNVAAKYSVPKFMWGQILVTDQKPYGEGKDLTEDDLQMFRERLLPQPAYESIYERKRNKNKKAAVVKAAYDDLSFVIHVLQSANAILNIIFQFEGTVREEEENTESAMSEPGVRFNPDLNMG